MKERCQAYFQDLQERICAALAAADGGAFREDLWQRAEGGGGRSRVLTDGALFERAGVNFSAVHGELPEALAARLEGGQDRAFFATGVSLVIHPRSPYVPTVHMNYRYLERGERSWFGGGADLTPYYPFREDAIHFHRTLKAACDRHDPAYYPRFKAECDRYFYLPHRAEARGVGGIFFDYLEGDQEALFAFVQTAGDAFLDAYLPIVERRRALAWGERERSFQLYRRGRYVEFNLLHDRGTRFGIETRGRAESILMSLPPLARWEYDWHPEPGSPEAALYTDFLPPRDWANEPDAHKIPLPGDSQ